MHKKYNFNFLFLIASIFVLSSCNSDTDEPLMFEEYITYYGLNFEVNVKTKYFDFLMMLNTTQVQILPFMK